MIMKIKDFFSVKINDITNFGNPIMIFWPLKMGKNAIFWLQNGSKSKFVQFTKFNFELFWHFCIHWRGNFDSFGHLVFWKYGQKCNFGPSEYEQNFVVWINFTEKPLILHEICPADLAELHPNDFSTQIPWNQLFYCKLISRNIFHVLDSSHCEKESYFFVKP